MNSSITTKHNGYLWKIKKLLRSRLCDLLQHISKRDAYRDILISIIREQSGYPKPRELMEALTIAPPYADLGYGEKLNITSLRSDIIFVTGRFRSGSTLVWNLFRNIPNVTSYYEPFNERRWFDPINRGLRVDPTHRNVANYWIEYDGLDILGNYYNDAWTYRQLFMDAGSWNPSMQLYIDILVENAKGRPVLQFNRVDFRLPWLQNRFPNAKILHIFRHPRDQWCSTLGKNFAQWSELTLQDFESIDGFYLINWGWDLHYYFPFLTINKTAHPYELFYQIWKLSYIFGCTYSNLSIALEDILASPELTIKKILTELSFESYNLDELVSLITPVRVKKWEQYADHEWFSEIEEKVDEQIRAYFHSPAFFLKQ